MWHYLLVWTGIPILEALVAIGAIHLGLIGEPDRPIRDEIYIGLRAVLGLTVGLACLWVVHPMKIVTDSNRIALPLMVSLGLAFAVNVGALVLAHIDILSFLTCPVAAIVSAHHLLRKSAS